MRAESRSDFHVADQFLPAVGQARCSEKPYRHWIMSDVFPEAIVSQLTRLPFAAPELAGISGTREVHNSSRQYFDGSTVGKFPVCKAVADVFCAPHVVAAIERAFHASLDGTFLRIEYARDVDGFWLEPHTDLGVKKFTMLYYLPDDSGQEKLGTDIFWDRHRHYGRPPFGFNQALIFVPANDTWHGFVKRPINGVRKSIIVNYVTEDWRAREQLCFPDPVRSG